MGSLRCVAGVSAWVLVAGCRCRPEPAGSAGGVDAGGERGAGAASDKPMAPLVAPLRAALVGGGAVLVAAVDPASKTVVAQRIEAGGRSGFRVPVFEDASGDQELQAFARPDGAVLSWRGGQGGKRVHRIMQVLNGGDLVSVPANAVEGVCVTEGGLSWIDPSGRASRVAWMPWGEGQPQMHGAPAGDREQQLACSAHRVFLIGEGDVDTWVSEPVAGAGRASRRRLIEDDFRDGDQEREHHVFTAGDELAAVRITQAGKIMVRETQDARLSPWRTLHSALEADDDVVAVDGSDRASIVVFTHEEDKPCPDGQMALKVRAVVAERSADGGRKDAAVAGNGARAPAVDRIVDLAAGECGGDLGSFFTGVRGGALLVGWVRLASHRAEGGPTIDGVSYAWIGGAPGPARRIDQVSDVVTFAGCDARDCAVVALVRPEGTAVGTPGQPRVLPLP